MGGRGRGGDEIIVGEEVRNYETRDLEGSSMSPSGPQLTKDDDRSHGSNPERAVEDSEKKEGHSDCIGDVTVRGHMVKSDDRKSNCGAALGRLRR